MFERLFYTAHFSDKEKLRFDNYYSYYKNEYDEVLEVLFGSRFGWIENQEFFKF